MKGIMHAYTGELVPRATDAETQALEVLLESWIDAQSQAEELRKAVERFRGYLVRKYEG